MEHRTLMKRKNVEMKREWCFCGHAQQANFNRKIMNRIRHGNETRNSNQVGVEIKFKNAERKSITVNYLISHFISTSTFSEFTSLLKWYSFLLHFSFRIQIEFVIFVLRFLWFFSISANVFPFISVRLAFKSATLAGNCIVLSMEFNQTVKCLQIKRSVPATIRSRHFLVKLALANMFRVQFSLTWSRQLLTKFELELIDNYFIPNNSSLAKRTQRTITHAVITQLAKK